ncbi:MAG: TIGR00269 family protein [Thermoplasmata archaeon]|nr:TIGR00269 family protein [Thermoplasmata archaeon]
MRTRSNTKLGRKCDFCNKEAVEFVRYSGAHLCSQHFAEFFERRVKREIATQIDIGKRAVIGVGLSGGKDSSVCLYLINKIFSRHRAVRIVAITVNEGIEGYRVETIEAGKQLCKTLGVEHHIVSFKELFSREMDEIAGRDRRRACTYCGVLRRKALNLASKKLGCTVLATGLNLDDTVQSILMNFTRGDVEKLARMAPHVHVQPGLVPRILPLRSVPEREVYLYALLSKIPFSHAVCPYADLALRNQYRAIIEILDKENPSVKFGILKSHDEILPLLREKYQQKELQPCKICGEPSIREICKSCELLEGKVRDEMESM